MSDIKKREKEQLEEKEEKEGERKKGRRGKGIKEQKGGHCFAMKNCLLSCPLLPHSHISNCVQVQDSPKSKDTLKTSKMKNPSTAQYLPLGSKLFYDYKAC